MSLTLYYSLLKDGKGIYDSSLSYLYKKKVSVFNCYYNRSLSASV
ncbi:MAG: hypothetical protein K0S01_3975 [Herbinix sp.]|jgi:hypothetical protein|nr:hypothetical protein [Herbinix sp.]